MRALRLGADAVQLLIPHRRPFLFVDGVTGYERAAGGIGSSVLAHKAVGANEPVFEGHFRGSGERPGFALWPGVYTAEGLGQTANLLLVIVAIEEELGRRGRSPEEIHAAIASLETACRPDLSRGRVPPEASELVQALGDPSGRIGLAGALDIKWIEPVLAGSLLVYEVTLTHVVGSGRRFEIEARVDERPVARGTLTSSSPR
jgi:3-hydroxyacyl-[acyl-carrier-protein] dehydratase